MALFRTVVAIACAGLLLTSCGLFPAGDDETDRQSDTLATAIGYPRQPDAAGFARAALATRLGKYGDFSVLEATDLAHKRPGEPMARLVWRIHRAEHRSGWSTTPALTACYSVEFDHYGPVAEPSRVTCPENAVAITPAPLPRRDITSEFTPALEAVLSKLPATPSDAEVRAALDTGLPAPVVDPETKLASIPPEVVVRVQGADVGVALFARTGVESKDCLMGRRIGGTVTVWSLNWRDLGPLEKTCGAGAALEAP